jgi:phosphopantothenoylcysteine decarboxylase/phosphopantothenate--cysteine ligase
MPLDPDRHYSRNPRAVVITSGSGTLWSLPDEPAFRAAAVPASTVATLWELLATPVPGSVLTARIAADPDGPALEHLVERLLAQTLVLRGAPDELPGAPAASDVLGPATTAFPCRRLVLGVTGAVQAAFMAPAIQRLGRDFAQQVDVILTRSARRFITPHAIAALGVEVWHDPFERREGIRVPHAHLAEAADLVLVLPSSANALFRLAQGSCSDLLSLVVAGTRAPVVLVPSMSSAMWGHPAVRRNVARLRDDGAFVIEPGRGRAAGSDATCTVGGLGLGGDTANLLGALRAVLDLSR